MKSLFEQMGGTYREENGYLIPNLTLPEEEQSEIGVWGQSRLEYIKFWLISYKPITVHILAHTYHIDYGSYLSPYIIFLAWPYLSSYAFFA